MSARVRAYYVRGSELGDAPEAPGVSMHDDDPGAALPGWLVDVANKTSVPDVLRAFAKRAVDGTYERDDAEEAAAAAKAKAAAKAERAFDAFAGFERRTATFRDETMDRLGERFGGLAAALPEAVGALAANALAAGKGWKGSA